MAHRQEIVTSRTNPRVKQLRAAFAGQARLAGGLIAIEGDHLIEEALRSGQAPKTIFLSEDCQAPASLPRRVELIVLAAGVFASCVETQAPQGIAALLEPPVWSVKAMLKGSPLVLIAAGLQDPGNLGTLIRSAEAFGASGVLTTPGTVNAWNQKSIRASAGSIFRVPIATADAEAMKVLAASGVRLFAAMKDDAVAADRADLGGACAIMIGNEGAGLDATWLAQADERILIPCPGAVESLNAAVAGSLLLYEASRQRARGGARA